MDNFPFLSTSDAFILKDCLPNRKYPAGTPIFLDGDPSSSAMLVDRGKVRISVSTLDGEKDIAELGPGELFGEFGLLFESRRTASAYAVEDTSVIELPRNTLEILEKSSGSQITITVMENLIKIAGERLRRQDLEEKENLPAEAKADIEEKTRLATQHLNKVLPQADLINCFSSPRELYPGEQLCAEGEPSDGFYFIQSGTLDVTRADEDGKTRNLGTVEGPALVGEIGYFSGKPRSATLTAKTEGSYFFFWGPQLEALKKNKPADAARVLFTAAQLAICLLYIRK